MGADWCIFNEYYSLYTELSSLYCIHCTVAGIFGICLILLLETFVFRHFRLFQSWSGVDWRHQESLIPKRGADQLDSQETILWVTLCYTFRVYLSKLLNVFVSYLKMYLVKLWIAFLVSSRKWHRMPLIHWLHAAFLKVCHFWGSKVQDVMSQVPLKD